MSYPCLRGAIVLTSSNNRLRFKEGAGAVGNVDLAAGTYYLRSDGTASLATEIASKLSAFGAGGNTYTVEVDGDIDPANPGVTVTITRATGTDTFQLVVDGSTTFDMDLIGFPSSTANDANPKTSSVSAAGAWVGNDILREREPFGERVAEVARRGNGSVVGVSMSSHMVSWALGFAFVNEARMLLRANANDVDATLEAFVRRFGAGAAFEAEEIALTSGTTFLIDDGSNTFAVLHWSSESVQSFRPRRIGPGVPLYDLDMVAHEQVTT
jgi:hypothetical protein